MGPCPGSQTPPTSVPLAGSTFRAVSRLLFCKQGRLQARQTVLEPPCAERRYSGAPDADRMCLLSSCACSGLFPRQLSRHAGREARSRACAPEVAKQPCRQHTWSGQERRQTGKVGRRISSGTWATAHTCRIQGQAGVKAATRQRAGQQYMNKTPMVRLSVGRGHSSAACATGGRCRCQLRRQALAIIQASPPLAAAGAAAAAGSRILLHLHRVCRAQVGPLLGSRQQGVLAGCGAGLWVGGMGGRSAGE